MSVSDLRRQLKEAQQTIKALHQELEETNKGMLALTIELEQRIEQVQASEVRFESLVSTIPDIIYRIDKDGKFTFLNSAISLLGYTPDELIGKHFSEIMLPPDAESVSRETVLPKYVGKATGEHDSPKLFDERRTGQRRTQGLEIRLVSKGSKGTIPALVESLDFDLVPVEVSSSGVWEINTKTGSKTFVGSVGVVRDITERKMKDETIQAANSELLAINKELESFAYSVSHDLRAPLRSIDGFSQALLEDYADKLDEHGRDYVARVRSASQRMADLIDDLLTLSRTARIEMEYETVDLSSMAKSIVTDLKGTSPERHVQVDIFPGLVARGDTRLLGLLLENLLRNAWKFTSKHATAKIEFGVTNVDGVSAFFVRDDGAGFDMTYADKLFGAFQRLHSPNEFVGTGIGLATVQRIAHRHGGRVWAEGYVEKGATFYFTLPK